MNEEGVHNVFPKDVVEVYSSKSPQIIALMENGFYVMRSGAFYITKLGL